MNRRSIMMLLIGVIASLSGFAATALLRQRRCTGLGGTWTSTGCGLGGETIDAAAASDVIIGVVVAVALGFMLFRLLLFVTGRGPRQSR